jgi:hypothetical protein
MRLRLSKLFHIHKASITVPKLTPDLSALHDPTQLSGCDADSVALLRSPGVSAGYPDFDICV